LATGGSDGYCRIWDFQTVKESTSSIKAGREVSSTIILDPYSLLLVGDTEGIVVIWELVLGSGVIPRRQLGVEGPKTSPTVSNLAALRRADGVIHIFGTTDDGDVYRWELSKAIFGLDLKRKLETIDHPLENNSLLTSNVMTVFLQLSRIVNAPETLSGSMLT